MTTPTDPTAVDFAAVVADAQRIASDPEADPSSLREVVRTLAGYVDGLVQDNAAMMGEIERVTRILRREAEPRFGEGRVQDGKIAMQVEDPLGMGQEIGSRLAAMLDHVGAGNYAEMQFIPRHATTPDERITVIVQRWAKVTPHAARKSAEESLARAVALLAQHGIAWDGPVTFDPVLCRAPRAEYDWIVLDCNERPNVLRCSRCDGTEAVPTPVTADAYTAINAAFLAQHKDCQEGDAATLRRLRGER